MCEPEQSRSVAIATVGSRVLSRLEGALHPRAVRIFTPLCTRVPLAAAELTPAVADFVAKYEPRAATEGLYAHQAEVLQRVRGGEGPNVILTSATGSGKSLPFLAWVVERLSADPEATALLCFPTQALMWSQAERLARISMGDRRICAGELTLGGELGVGKRRIGWTVWKGKGAGATTDAIMARHERSPEFARARIRIATLDKAHFSLLWGSNREFARRLGAIVLDEAHVYDGVFGANVRLFLSRIAAGLELAGRGAPPVFLASATLGDPCSFASTLLSLDGTQSILHVADASRQEISEVALEEVPALLAAPPHDGLLRMVVIANVARDGARLQQLLSDARTIGDEVNAITFVESKFRGKQLGLQLRGVSQGERRVVAYDADLPPLVRRQVERTLNAPGARGHTVIATSALELGMDIDGLDLCIVEQTPPARQDLLQRIGRVGRRVGHPGLVVVGATVAPRDQVLIEQPASAFCADQTKTRPIPVHLGMLTWRHLLAAHNERLWSLDGGEVDPRQVSVVFRRWFGECPARRELEQRFQRLYGDLEEVTGTYWAHQGFRASLGQRKVPLRTPDGEDVAWIDESAVYRDAHPEGVYLGHDGRRWRVVRYESTWRVAKNRPPGTDVVLAKWLKCLTRIHVEPEPRGAVTRGEWEDSYTLHERANARMVGQTLPHEGELCLGTWNFSRQWRGYRQHELARGTVSRVSLAEVTRRFQEAVEQGDQFPFLHHLTYRTLGWRWTFGPIDAVTTAAGDDDAEPEASDLELVVGGLLQEFISAELECSPGDLSFRLSLRAGEFAVFDSAPGGNGLTHGLLAGDRMLAALTTCSGVLARLQHGSRREFARYVAALLDVRPDCDRREVFGVVETLCRRWHG